MRKWGIVISFFYALILLGLILPGSLFIAGGDLSRWSGLLRAVKESYADWTFWILAGALIASQILLLFLSVDTSHKRLKPRTHILVSCAVVTLLTALLSTAVIWSLGAAFRGDKFLDSLENLAKHFLDDYNYFGIFVLLLFWITLWLLWSILFYLYYRNSAPSVTRLISWLLKGSVLELLIVVPCHIIVRRRHECSAPLATSFGIATGLAIMLLSFGPSVLFLYKKRLDSYLPRSST
jgi:hypothetical protein